MRNKLTFEKILRHKDSYGDIWLNEKETMAYISQSLRRVRKDTIKKMIELSDTVESQYETEFSEWRAFKFFRNKMRDELNNLK